MFTRNTAISHPFLPLDLRLKIHLKILARLDQEFFKLFVEIVRCFPTLIDISKMISLLIPPQLIKILTGGSNGGTYRTEDRCMSAAARDYWVVPGSEVAVERLFSR